MLVKMQNLLQFEYTFWPGTAIRVVHPAYEILSQEIKIPSLFFGRSKSFTLRIPVIRFFILFLLNSRHRFSYDLL